MTQIVFRNNIAKMSRRCFLPGFWTPDDAQKLMKRKKHLESELDGMKVYSRDLMIYLR